MLYSLPWVEKYRPKNINNIILSKTNETILNNIIHLNHFPNLLLYGPPGTGKTTTIINIIKSWQIKNNQYNKSLSVHLNASDERGIDIIRNNITQFIKMDGLFIKGTKFIILDEVDYMTKCAQLALKYLLQCEYNVRFCLMCNYISKIDICLQRYFVKLKFNNLSKLQINNLLKNIIEKENLNIDEEILYNIQKEFNNDIRSAINYLQCNYSLLNNNSMITNMVFSKTVDLLKDDKICINTIIKSIIKDTINYNINYSIFIDLCSKYILDTYDNINSNLLNILNKVNNNNIDYEYLIFYFVAQLKGVL